MQPSTIGRDGLAASKLGRKLTLGTLLLCETPPNLGRSLRSAGILGAGCSRPNGHCVVRATRWGYAPANRCV